MRLFFEQLQKRRRQANGAKQIGGDGGFRVGKVVLLGQQIFGPHNASVVDEHIQRGKLRRYLGGEGANGLGAFNVESERLHAGVGVRGLIQSLLSPPCDDDLVTQLVQLFRQPAANARPAAGDENRIAGILHGVCISRKYFNVSA